MAFLTHLGIGVLGAAVAAVVVVCPLAAQPVGPDRSLEDDVKAAYLYNFTKFVGWPPTAFPETSDPLVVCIAADGAFTRAVERIVTGEMIDGRPLRVVGPEPDSVTRCHVLFVGRGAQDRLSRLVAAAERAPVLTVSDAPRFLQQGGMIAFVLENKRVRFDINLAAAERVGLRVSSKLLRVARRVSDSGTTR